ncbi:hypothetical protein KCP71_21090 [Salmonella enterica subsp. enterica]|nr:hypothetical protein KCP71_21090 [Salmonella enterica subsp. enterica]
MPSCASDKHTHLFMQNVCSVLERFTLLPRRNKPQKKPLVQVISSASPNAKSAMDNGVAIDLEGVSRQQARLSGWAGAIRIGPGAHHDPTRFSLWRCRPVCKVAGLLRRSCRLAFWFQRVLYPADHARTQRYQYILRRRMPACAATNFNNLLT